MGSREEELPIKRKSKRVTYGNRSKTFDAKIAPLVLECWKAKIATEGAWYSDSGDYSRHASIDFRTSRQLAAFLTCICVGKKPEITELRTRIAVDGVTDFTGPQPITKNTWLFSMSVSDHGSVLNRYTGESVGIVGPPKFSVMPRVYIPHCDLTLVVKQLRAYNRMQA